jgi:hypothetical protein
MDWISGKYENLLNPKQKSLQLCCVVVVVSRENSARFPEDIALTENSRS